MDIINQNKLFNYYETKIHLKEDSVKYYFEIQRDSGVIYYNRLGAKSEHAERGDFEIIPGFSVPDWAKGAVMYQIFTDRFCNGDKSNDVLSDEYAYINEHVSRAEDWNQLPREMDVREFYGGDIAGIIKKLDYLSDMGVEVICLNPIFVSPSNHKYDIQDYDYVDRISERLRRITEIFWMYILMIIHRLKDINAVLLIKEILKREMSFSASLLKKRTHAE